LPFHYSYKVQLRGIENEINSLKLNLIVNPNNARAKKLLIVKESEAKWYRDMIAQGKDPGPMVL